MVSGEGSLTKDGAGTLTLTGENIYTGGTTISAGTLRSAMAGRMEVAGNVLNNSALVFNRSGDVTFGDIISGTGSLTKVGAGTLTLSGNNTYSGMTTVDPGLVPENGRRSGHRGGGGDANGTLNLLSSETIGSLDGSGAVTLNANTLITGGNNTSTVFSGVASGTGGLPRSARAR